MVIVRASLHSLSICAKAFSLLSKEKKVPVKDVLTLSQLMLIYGKIFLSFDKMHLKTVSFARVVNSTFFHEVCWNWLFRLFGMSKFSRSYYLLLKRNG